MSNTHNSKHQGNIGNIKIAFVLNLVFTVIEIIGGMLTNSIAIISDALHDFGDSLALGMSWYLEKYSKKERSNIYSYGYRRFSLLAALISSLVLVIGSIYVVSEAAKRLLNPQHPNAEGMMWLAIAGIIINGIAALRLKKGTSFNEAVISWHLIEDVLGWIAVLIVSIIIQFRDIHILDPILSLLITVYILSNVIKNLKKTMVLFLQGVPENISIEAIEQDLLKLDGVKAVHDTHIWSLDGENHIMTTHIVVNASTTSDDVIAVKDQTKKLIRTYGIDHATTEVEYENEDCNVDHTPDRCALVDHWPEPPKTP